MFASRITMINISRLIFPLCVYTFHSQSVILLRLPGPCRRLLGLTSRSVQLILYIHEPVQDEEEEQAHAGYERVALLAEHRLLDLARRTHADGAEQSQIVQRVKQRAHDEVEVHRIQDEETDGEVLYGLAFPQAGYEVGDLATDAVRWHRQD